MAEAAKGKKAVAKPVVDETPDVVEPGRAESGRAESDRAESDRAESDRAESGVVPPEQAPVTADTKSAFQAALERKKQAGQARSAHLDGHGGVGGATSSHKATRTFRRKSGSA